MFHGFYAAVEGEGYGDEIEIKYFKEKTGEKSRYWVLTNHDYDCREPDELSKVMPIEINRRNQFYFE